MKVLPIVINNKNYLCDEFALVNSTKNSKTSYVVKARCYEEIKTAKNITCGSTSDSIEIYSTEDKNKAGKLIKLLKAKLAKSVDKSKLTATILSEDIQSLVEAL